MKPLLVILLLIGCGAPPAEKKPICTSKCGLKVFSFPERQDYEHQWSCDVVQLSEDRAVLYFKATQDYKLWESCPKFYGISVGFHDDPSWYSPTSGFNVAGLTFCNEKRILIGNKAPGYASLVHELAHIAQGCVPQKHEDWNDKDIYKAIDNANTSIRWALDHP